mgnify:CR=1 FL=1
MSQKSDPTPSLDSTTVTGLVHLYRGELGRMVSYRIRLDTTTNWAIVTNVGLTTVAFSNADVSHAVFLFAMVLTFFFLQLEARRFRVYELSHRRVRLLERSFYGEVLTGQGEPNWRETLAVSLREPSHTMSHVQAFAWRLRRNYLWIYLGLLLVWLMKLELFQTSDFIAQAHVAAIPGWLVIFIVLVFYSFGGVLAFWVGRYRLEDD